MHIRICIKNENRWLRCMGTGWKATSTGNHGSVTIGELGRMWDTFEPL